MSFLFLESEVDVDLWLDALGINGGEISNDEQIAIPTDEKVSEAFVGPDNEFTFDLGDAFGNLTEQVIGIGEHHDEDAILCPIGDCDIFLDDASITAHLAELHDERVETVANSDLNSVFAQNGSKDFPCPVRQCEACFSSNENLRIHVRKVHSQPVKCPHKNCGKYFKPGNLAQHIKGVHEKLIEVCEHCGKQISYGNLRHHIAICKSNGEKKFECAYEGCNASFTAKHNVRIHIREVHSSLVKCPRDNCDSWVKAGYLAKHIRGVHDKVKKLCENCGKQISYGKFSRHNKSCTTKVFVKEYFEVKK